MEKIDSLEKLKHVLEEPFLKPLPLTHAPLLTVVIPTFNNMESIRKTILSILEQKECPIEVVLVDAYSSDQTIEVVKGLFQKESFHSLKILLRAKYHRFIMFNEGAKEAKGDYLAFLYPGDTYLFPYAVRFALAEALDKGKKEVIISASEIRDGKGEPKIFFRSLNEMQLEKGKQPSTLQSCFIKKRFFYKTGGFSDLYEQRGGLDWFCHFINKKEVKVLFLKRVLTEYDLRFVTRRMICTRFIETGKIIFKYFGFISYIKWLFLQKDTRRLLLSFWNSCKTAFTG